MATGPNSAGIDVLGIAAPLVDLGFTLVGNYKISATLIIGGKQKVNAQTDAKTLVGAISLTVPAISSKATSKEGADVTARDKKLTINMADLTAAATQANLQSVPTVKENDTVVIVGVTWTIFSIISPPGSLILQLIIRR